MKPQLYHTLPPGYLIQLINTSIENQTSKSLTICIYCQAHFKNQHDNKAAMAKHYSNISLPQEVSIPNILRPMKHLHLLVNNEPGKFSFSL